MFSKGQQSLNDVEITGKQAYFQWDYIEGAVGLRGDLTKHCRNQTPSLTKLANERKQSVLHDLLNHVSLQKKKKKSICHQMNHDAHIIAS